MVWLIDKVVPFENDIFRLWFFYPTLHRSFRQDYVKTIDGRAQQVATKSTALSEKLKYVRIKRRRRGTGQTAWICDDLHIFLPHFR